MGACRTIYLNAFSIPIPTSLSLLSGSLSLYVLVAVPCAVLTVLGVVLLPLRSVFVLSHACVDVSQCGEGVPWRRGGGQLGESVMYVFGSVFCLCATFV